MADQRSALDGAEVRADSSAAELLRRSLPGTSFSTFCMGMPLSLAYMHLCFMLALWGQLWNHTLRSSAL